LELPEFFLLTFFFLSIVKESNKDMSRNDIENIQHNDECGIPYCGSLAKAALMLCGMWTLLTTALSVWVSYEEWSLVGEACEFDLRWFQIISPISSIFVIFLVYLEQRNAKGNGRPNIN
jgi:hypothetical protein